MELLIALVLFVLVVFGIANIEVFCRMVFTGSDRKAKVINEAGYVIEHMSKFIGGAIGDPVDMPVNLTTPPNYCTRAVKVWVDYDPSGVLNGIKDASDRQIMYCYNATSHTLVYYSNYTGDLTPGTAEILTRNIVDFNVTTERNAVDVNVTGCWDSSVPAGDPKACGTVDNPRLTLQTRITMPSVSFDSAQ